MPAKNYGIINFLILFCKNGGKRYCQKSQVSVYMIGTSSFCHNVTDTDLSYDASCESEMYQRLTQILETFLTS